MPGKHESNTNQLLVILCMLFPQISSMSSFINFNVYKPSPGIPECIKLSACFAAVRSAFTFHDKMFKSFKDFSC